MEYVTLVNRSSKNLEGVWDGRHYELAPGKHSFPRVQAEKFVAQNPVMGSEDPYTLEKLYLIGIEENGDDCSPIEQTASIELMNRRQMPNAGIVEVIKGNGMYAPHGVDATAPPVRVGGPVDTSFVKP